MKKFTDNLKPISGEATVSVCKVVTSYAKRREQEILEAIKAKVNWQEYRRLVDDFHKMFLVRQFVAHNVICDRGKAVLARILANDFTYSGVPNYCSLGTGTSAGDHADTKLGTEVYRKLIAAKTFVGLSTYLSTFFGATECSGTYKEIGHHIDGTAAADSGQIWSHIGDPDTAELPVTKTTSSSLTIDYKSTFN
jgi:hypothetical protein